MERPSVWAQAQIHNPGTFPIPPPQGSCFCPERNNGIATLPEQMSKVRFSPQPLSELRVFPGPEGASEGMGWGVESEEEEACA